LFTAKAGGHVSNTTVYLHDSHFYQNMPRWTCLVFHITKPGKSRSWCHFGMKSRSLGLT